MRDYIIKLKAMIGFENTDELIQYTFKTILEVFGNVRSDKALKIARINIQFLLDLSVLKAKETRKEEITKIVKEKYKSRRKFLLATNIDEFEKIYEKYLELILNYLKMEEN